MQRLVILLVTAIFIQACKQEIANWRINYPPELETQVKLFKEYAPPDLKVRKLTIVLTGNAIKNSNGLFCAGLSAPREKKIYLDTTSTHWLEYKTALLMHELGHYVLDRDHFNEFHTELLGVPTIPKSVMIIRPEVKEEYFMDRLDLRDYYMNELFNGP